VVFFVVLAACTADRGRETCLRALDRVKDCGYLSSKIHAHVQTFFENECPQQPRAVAKYEACLAEPDCDGFGACIEDRKSLDPGGDRGDRRR